MITIHWGFQGDVFKGVQRVYAWQLVYGISLYACLFVWLLPAHTSNLQIACRMLYYSLRSGVSMTNWGKLGCSGFGDLHRALDQSEFLSQQFCSCCCVVFFVSKSIYVFPMLYICLSSRYYNDVSQWHCPKLRNFCRDFITTLFGNTFTITST